MQLLRRSDYAHRQLSSAKTGEQYSRSAEISAVLGCNAFNVRHEILAPGHRASAPHFHHETDEVVIVTKGYVTIHEGDQSFVLAPGDSANFSSGSEKPHWVRNDSETEAELLTITKKLARPDAAFVGI